MGVSFNLQCFVVWLNLEPSTTDELESETFGFQLQCLNFENPFFYWLFLLAVPRWLFKLFTALVLSISYPAGDAFPSYMQTSWVWECNKSTGKSQTQNPRNGKVLTNMCMWCAFLWYLSLICYMWLSMLFHVIHIRLHLVIDSKFKSSFWIIIVNARIEES